VLFNSLEFFCFFALVWVVYLILPFRAQNLLLVVASYVFYAAWDWRFLGLIALSTLIDFTVGQRLGRSEDARVRKRLVTISIVANLGILGLFKYTGFFADSLRELLGLFGTSMPSMVWTVVLPVGISFYTFQTMSYTIDVYRRRLAPTGNLLDFALYVAFFPQLVAGPIERAVRLLPQIAKPRRPSWNAINSGAWLVLAGLFKKVVVADNLSHLVERVYSQPGDATGFEVIFATWAFAWQIYCDFSGYTDIARGISRMLGFELMLNFNLPYLAMSPADFWRRWHISLSSWLRDYLYVPLGGNRGGTLLTYRNLALTMLLGGLWHGAAWTFVLWGAYQGVLLIGHRLAQPLLLRVAPAPGLASKAWWLLRVVVMFQLTCVGWLIFRADSWAHLTQLCTAILSGFELGQVGAWLAPVSLLLLPLMLYQVLQHRTKEQELVLRWPVLGRALVYVSLFYSVVLLGEDFGQTFLYFQF
jgi:D-alanyl-lipoteichoic acid acyltransferase DltB (MBOAT superfamily)